MSFAMNDTTINFDAPSCLLALSVGRQKEIWWTLMHRAKNDWFEKANVIMTSA
jgi:hypothetical protein